MFDCFDILVQVLSLLHLIQIIALNTFELVVSKMKKYLFVANVFVISVVLGIRPFTSFFSQIPCITLCMLFNLLLWSTIWGNTIDDPGSLIVNGFATSIDQNPWQVSLQRKESHFCGGSIIGKKWILIIIYLDWICNLWILVDKFIMLLI